jgi:tRNA pseudouridine55 synthase
VIDVVCSKGTYVRTLAETIGEMLACGAHLRALRRTGSGPLDLARAVSLADLEAADDATRLAHLLRPDVLLADCPAVHLPEAEAGRFLSGLRRPLDQPDQARVRVYGPGLDGAAPVLLGSARLSAGELIAERLLSPPEVAALMQPAALSPPLSHPPIPSGLAAPALA